MVEFYPSIINYHYSFRYCNRSLVLNPISLFEWPSFLPPSSSFFFVTVIFFIGQHGIIKIVRSDLSSFSLRDPSFISLRVYNQTLYSNELRRNGNITVVQRMRNDKYVLLVSLQEGEFLSLSLSLFFSVRRIYILYIYVVWLSNKFLRINSLQGIWINSFPYEEEKN